MRASLAALAILVLITAGCTRVHRVDPTAESDPFRELNALAGRSQSEIELTDGRTRAGERLHATRDTVSWYDTGRGEQRYAVPTHQVSKVRVKHRWSGTGRWALWGLAAGGLIGGSLGWGLATGTDLGGAGGALIFGAMGGGVGAGIGALTGFLVGDREEYSFEGFGSELAGETAHPPRSTDAE